MTGYEITQTDLKWMQGSRSKFIKRVNRHLAEQRRQHTARMSDSYLSRYSKAISIMAAVAAFPLAQTHA